MSVGTEISPFVYESEIVDDDFYAASGFDLSELFGSLFGPAPTPNPTGNRVFDWDKAARRIAETGATNARAGLQEDWYPTSGTILQDGEIVVEYAHLESYWATPVLELDGVQEECWVLAADSDYDHATNWPASAVAVVGGGS